MIFLPIKQDGHYCLATGLKKGPIKVLNTLTGKDLYSYKNNQLPNILTTKITLKTYFLVKFTNKSNKLIVCVFIKYLGVKILVCFNLKQVRYATFCLITQLE